MIESGHEPAGTTGDDREEILDDLAPREEEASELKAGKVIFKTDGHQSS